jgi:hypothetical protein
MPFRAWWRGVNLTMTVLGERIVSFFARKKLVGVAQKSVVLFDELFRSRYLGYKKMGF